MIEGRVAKRIAAHTRERLRVGDRVRFLLGNVHVTADVIEDRGDIGVGGRQLVGLSYRAPWGEAVRSELAAEEVTLLPAQRRRKNGSRPNPGR